MIPISLLAFFRYSYFPDSYNFSSGSHLSDLAISYALKRGFNLFQLTAESVNHSAALIMLKFPYLSVTASLSSIPLSLSINPIPLCITSTSQSRSPGFCSPRPLESNRPFPWLAPLPAFGTLTAASPALRSSAQPLA